MAFAWVGADVFDGAQLLQGHAVLVQGGRPEVMAEAALPEGVARHVLNGGVVMPGFVDLQVNGGGGVMLNDAPTVETVARIAQAHARLGTRALLPTLITDTEAKTAAAIEAVQGAIKAGVPGVLGLHLEGPHLDETRKGAHDGDLIRPMDDADLQVILRAADVLPNVMVTVAPEAVGLDQIKAMAHAGVIVSLGHTNCTYAAAMAAFDAGARCVTHLFNAMSQMGSREPGLVGAALEAGVPVGLIADGVHVDPASIRLALRAKAKGEVFLVTDAMAPAGSEITRFALNGREILRAGGELRLADGTLAGADLDLGRALAVMVRDVGEDLGVALARATRGPAAVLSDALGFGEWPARVEGLVHLGAGFEIEPLG